MEGIFLAVVFYSLMVLLPTFLYYKNRGAKHIWFWWLALTMVFLPNVPEFNFWLLSLYFLVLMVVLSRVYEKKVKTIDKELKAQQEDVESDIQELIDGKPKQLILKVIIDSMEDFSEKAVIFTYSEAAKVIVETIKIKDEAVYSINDVVINKDINMETKKKWLGRTAVGSVVAGPFGMLIGAMTAGEKEVLKNNNSSAVISLTNLEDNSQRRLIVKLDKKNEHELRMIPTTGTTQPIDEAIMDEKDKMEAIREYKKMFDEGILTESEFNDKKQQLLS